MYKFRIKRIPVFFVVDAPESVTGNWLERSHERAMEAILGYVTKVTSIVPALALHKDISLKNKLIISLLVNPSRFTVIKTPRVNQTLTKRGMLYQYWRAEPDTLQIEGRAASERAFFVMSQFDALTKATENGTRNVVTMIYKYGGIYNGFIDNFRIDIDAERPGIFDYSFNFIFADKKHFRIWLMSVTNNSLNKALQYPKEWFSENIKLGASEILGASGFSFGR